MAEVPKSIRTVNRRQYLLLGALVLLILFIALIAAMMGSTPKPPVQDPTGQKAVKTRPFGDLGAPIDPAERWRTESQAELTDMNQRMHAVESLAKQLQDLADAKKQAAENQAPPASALPNRGAGAAGQAPSDPGQLPGQPPASRDINDLGSLSPDQLPPKQMIKGMVRVVVSEGPAAGAVSSADAKSQPQKHVDSYVPTGTFIRGQTLSGMDAPTGGQAQQNPLPVLIRVTDMAQLPNRFKKDVRECFITGNGYGDLSSERVFVRTERLSCIDENGGVIDVDIKGFVTDESGKTGIRGKLISKQGAILANALLAGVVSGIGEGLALSTTTTSVSPLGSTTTVNQGEYYKHGVATGISKATDRLAQYYMDLADKMFPIVEVDAKRDIDIVITSGIPL